MGNDAVEKLKTRLLNKLGSRVRTAKQLRDWSLQQGYECEVVDEAISALVRVQAIDDLAYAAAIVRSKVDLAAPELRRRLLVAGVSEEHIHKALGERSGTDEEACYRLVTKLWPRMSKLPYEAAQRRILNQLKRRGFDFRVAMRSLERIAGER